MDTTLDINDDPSDSDLVYRLKARIRELEATFGSDWKAPRCLHLTPWEERFLGLLIARERVTYSAIYDVLYANRLNPPDSKIITVYLCKLRKKLRPFAVEILTDWGVGLQIEMPSINRLNALYDSAQP